MDFSKYALRASTAFLVVVCNFAEARSLFGNMNTDFDSSAPEPDTSEIIKTNDFGDSLFPLEEKTADLTQPLSTTRPPPQSNVLGGLLTDSEMNDLHDLLNGVSSEREDSIRRNFKEQGRNIIIDTIRTNHDLKKLNRKLKQIPTNNKATLVPKSIPDYHPT